MTLCAPTTIHMGTGGHTQNLLEFSFIFLLMKICSFYFGQHNVNEAHFPAFIADITIPRVSVLEGQAQESRHFCPDHCPLSTPLKPRTGPGRPVASAQETCAE